MPPTTAPTTQTVEFPCENCNTKVIANLPQASIVNLKAASMVIWPHEQPAKCTGCGAIYFPLVGQLRDIAWGFQRAPDTAAQSGQIIAPPPGFNPTKLH